MLRPIQAALLSVFLTAVIFIPVETTKISMEWTSWSFFKANWMAIYIRRSDFFFSTNRLFTSIQRSASPANETATLLQKYYGRIHCWEPCTEWLLKWWSVCHTLSLTCRRRWWSCDCPMTLWSFPMKIEAFLINRLCARTANTHINNRFQSPFKCGDNADNRARVYAMVIIVEMLISDISINRFGIECGETWGNSMRLIGEWGEKWGINRHLVLEQPNKPISAYGLWREWIYCLAFIRLIFGLWIDCR